MNVGSKDATLTARPTANRALHGGKSKIEVEDRHVMRTVLGMVDVPFAFFMFMVLATLYTFSAPRHHEGHRGRCRIAGAAALTLTTFLWPTVWSKTWTRLDSRSP
jgi:hypothetical protein